MAGFVYTAARAGATLVAMGKQAPSHFIRAWRKHRQLTQEQLAERIGIDRSYLSQIESGKRRYDQHFLEAAALELRCSPADLIVRDPTEPDPIWSVWERVAAPDREQAIAVLRTFMEKKSGTHN